MHVNPRVIVATIAVAVATFLFSLLAAPLLSLVPVGTAYAQEGPSIEITFDPEGTVVSGTEIGFTVTFSGLTATSVLQWRANVVGGGDPDRTACEGDGAFNDNMESIGTISGGTATTTGTIASTCPAGLSILVVSLYDSDGVESVEIISTAKGFVVTAVKKLSLRNAITRNGVDLLTPNSVAGLWGERIAKRTRPDGNAYGTTDLHVVDSASSTVYVYELPVYNYDDTKDYDDRDHLIFRKKYQLASTTSPWGIVASQKRGIMEIMWVSDDRSASGTASKIIEYRKSGDQLTVNREISLNASSTSPKGIHFTGDIYVVDSNAHKIFGYVVQGNSRTPETYVLTEENADPTGIWASGDIMWVADVEDEKLYAYDMYPTQDRLPESDVNGITGNPAGVWSDYSQIYVLDSEAKEISGYRMPQRNYSPHIFSGLSFVKYPENGTDSVGTYEARDPEGRLVNWSLHPTGDSEHFGITHNGKLYFKQPPDFEEPKSEDKDNEYHLIITASSGEFAHSYFPVRVEVTDVLGEQPYFPDASTTRTVEENTLAGENIGDPVEAINPDDDPTHIYSLSGGDAASFDFDTSNAQITTKAALDFESKPSYSVRVSVRDDEDEDENPSTSTDDFIDVTINVTDIYEGPTVNGDDYIDHPENTLQVAEYTADDPNSRSTGWQPLSGDDSGKFRLSATGVLSFKSAPDHENPTDKDGNNDYEVTIKVSAGNETGSLDVTVNVHNVNEPPTFSSRPVNRSVAENRPANENVGDPVTASDVDVDDSLSYDLGSDDTSDFYIDPTTGQILTSISLDHETKERYNVTVIASDSAGATSSIEVAITVTDANDQPVFAETTTDRSVVENTNNAIVGAPVAATDQDQDTLRYELTGGATSTFTINSRTGQLKTVESLDKETRDAYSVTVSVRDNRDNQGSTDSAEDDSIDVTITVTDGNDPPTFPGATTSLEVTENTAAGEDVGSPVSATDSESDDLTYSLSGSDASHFDIVTSTGQILTKGALDYESNKKSYSVTVEVTDNRNVQGGADPTIDDTIEVTINVIDVDESGSLTLSPAQPRVAAPVTATLSDPDGTISDLTWTWESATSSTWTTVRTATSSSDTSDSHTPADADLGKSLRVTVAYTDGFGSGKSATTSATVTHGNQPPNLSGQQTVTYPENKTGAVATYTFSDPEGEDVVLRAAGTDGSHFRFQGGQLNFIAQPDFEKPSDTDVDNVYHLTIVADDRTRTTSLSVTVTVTGVNEPPQFPNSDTGIRGVSENTEAGQNVGAPVRANDPEGDPLTYSLSGSHAGHFDIDSSTGQLLAKSELDYDQGRRSYSVRVSVRDGLNAAGNADTATDHTIDITINVIGDDEGPVITGATSTTFAENSTRAVASYTGRDPERGTVTWTVLGTDKAYFAITNSGVLSFDPAPNFENEMDSDRNNVYHVTVQASDGNNISRLDMTVTVTNVEEAGTVELSSVQPQVDTPLTATLHDPDEVTSAITWSWHSSTRKNGGWNLISGEASDSYTPVAEDVNKYLKVTASYDDGFSSGKSASAISANKVRAEPVDNQPPRFGTNSASRAVEENTAPGSNIGAPVTATDDVNDNLTYRLVGTNAGMFRIVRTTGQIQTRMPLDHETTPSYSVTVKAFDPFNASSTIPVTISVTDINEPPVVVDDVVNATEDGSAVAIDVLANDSDPDVGDTLTLVSTTQPSNGTSTIEQGMVKYTPNPGYYGSDQFTYTVSDGDLSTVGKVIVRVASTGDATVETATIPIQFVPIDGGGERILLSDYFSDPDSGHPPYQATTSDAAIATVEVSEGYLTITPVGIGVATTTLTVSDTPGISQEFRVVVYRPVVPRTNTETVHIVDPDVETTLTSADDVLSVLSQTGARDLFFQTAIDAHSNNCGVEAPIGHQHVCVLVDLFDLGAESIEENLDQPSTMYVTLSQAQYTAVQNAIDNGEFTMWKGHGPTDVSWQQVSQCPDPVGQDECYSLVADPNGNGGEITVFNISGFSEFAAGLEDAAPPPTDPPTTSPPPDNTGGGGSGGGSGSSGSSGGSRSRSSSSYSSTGNQAPQIFGQKLLTYPENGTDAVAEYTVRDPDEDDEITWSLLGVDRRLFNISGNGVLTFRSPPDFENPEGRNGNTYRIVVQAEDDGRPSEWDVITVKVTVTQVNELGLVTGDAELSVSEDHNGAIAQFRVDDPEKGVIAWSLSGPDAAGFKMDDQGNLLPATSLDFETPGSSAGDNTHVLTISATDNGEPEASAQLDVTVTISNVNEAPWVSSIPDIDLTTRHLTWMLDLGEYFTDPDGDSLSYEISGRTSTDVAHAAVDGGTLSITPAGDGTVSIYVVAADSGGLRVVGKVAVSVTEPAPAPTPVPAKVTVPVPTSTPAPVTVVDTVPTPVVPQPPPVVAPEPSPTYVPLSLLSERRWRNLAQQPDKVSKLIATFKIEPQSAPMAELLLPLMVTPVPPKYVTPMDDIAAGNGPGPMSVALDDDGGLSIWLMVLLALIAMVTAGYAVRMYVIHRL